MTYRSVSVIIPAYNEDELLPPLLGDLASQSYAGHEVIVADADSDDETQQVARAGGARVIRGGMPAVGRNAGAKHATGDLLVFLDADVRLPPSFLHDVVNEMNERSLRIATCEYEPLSDLQLDRVMHKLANLFVRLNQRSDPHAPGFCIFCDRRLFEEIDGFDESVKLAEDHDLVKRAAEIAPFRVLNGPSIEVSVRRMEKDGRLNYIRKSVQIVLYRMLHGEVRSDQIFDYDFGDFSATDTDVAERRLRSIERRINALDRRVSRFERKYLNRERLMERAAHAGTRLQQQISRIGSRLEQLFRSGEAA